MKPNHIAANMAKRNIVYSQSLDGDMRKYALVWSRCETEKQSEYACTS